MPISTYKSFLMQKSAPGNTWTKLVDIKEFPDLGGDPEMLETTTLSDKMQTYIAGIQSMDGLSFTANYTLADYKTLKAKEGTEADYAVWFGGTESGGSVTPTGSVYPTGGGVNEVVGMNITIAPTTVITLDDGE